MRGIGEISFSKLGLQIEAFPGTFLIFLGAAFQMLKQAHRAQKVKITKTGR